MTAEPSAIDPLRLAETIGWLTDGCPSAPTADQALDEICTRLTACGVPLAYGAIFVRTLHPEIMGRREIGRTILASADFALQCPQQIEQGGLTPLGSCMLKGVTVPQRGYGVA